MRVQFMALECFKFIVTYSVASYYPVSPETLFLCAIWLLEVAQEYVLMDTQNKLPQKTSQKASGEHSKCCMGLEMGDFQANVVELHEMNQMELKLQNCFKGIGIHERNKTCFSDEKKIKDFDSSISVELSRTTFASCTGEVKGRTKHRKFVCRSFY